ncbi:hypothetical protein [Aureimonas pseudogalii]|uniref:Uncharacterized protein n=1 Tax=Aureimonas pseudogalii TaxID=1744844 RepID=A0A7W6H8H5_9HYPH|nr:hypothetical protein [Aureimonas pseudogalii]MBB4000492.1 hypothetical protein [Aureimonas pseudogalii]
MTNRYQPNEAPCPAPLELLARLLRVSDEQAAETIGSLPERQRAELAVFCYGRAHMRDLGLQIAALCSEAMMTRTAGQIGNAVFHQARQIRTATKAVGEPYRRTVTLARCA